MSVSPFERLPPRDRVPGSTRHLQRWVEDAGRTIGSPAGERVGWLVASTVVVAALQRAVDADGRALFLLKGGVYLEHRLGQGARATKDVDTLFRGGVETFTDDLDRALVEPWGPLSLTRGAVEEVRAPRLVAPRRFDVVLSVRGVTWRRIQVEVAFPEGQVAENAEPVPSPPLGFFGLADAPDLVAITMAYQVAQKIHACTDPHLPPEHPNTRVRDVADLLLIHDRLYPEPHSWGPIAAACTDVFAARAEEADALGIPVREWPPVVVANETWEAGWPRVAASTGSPSSLSAAVAEVNGWIEALATR